MRTVLLVMVLATAIAGCWTIPTMPAAPDVARDTGDEVAVDGADAADLDIPDPFDVDDLDRFDANDDEDVCGACADARMDSEICLTCFSDVSAFDVDKGDVPRTCWDVSECDDQIPCTTDVCGLTGCTHVLQADWCLINGSCVASGANQGKCLTCDPTKATVVWTYVVGKLCDDQDACTKNDSCAAGGTGDAGCKGTSFSCSDGQACTDDVCDGIGGCTNPLQPAFCLIDGTCRGEGDENPSRLCEWCRTELNKELWTVREDGDPCGPGSCQGEVYTTAKSCDSGECTGASTSRSCDDRLECTSDTCSAAKGCQHEVLEGWCLVGGECRGEGQPDPGNACQVCSHVAGPTVWSAATDGVVCDPSTCTEGVWKQGKTCVSGQCTAGGGMQDCDDGISCTADECEPSVGCMNPVLPGKCLILGVCRSDWNTNPLNACEACNPLASDVAWTVLGDGVRCASGSCVGSWWTQPETCLQGTCTGGGATQNCDDARACTIDGCNPDGGCSSALQDGYCLIGGVCRYDGQPNPLNACKVCDIMRGTQEWSELDDGTVCKMPSCAGLSWTEGRECLSGVCPAGAAGNCDDGLSCTTDACNAFTGCSSVLKPGFCLIAGQCFATDQANPANGCEVCTPGNGVTTWSTAKDGAECLASACEGLTWRAKKTCAGGQCRDGGQVQGCDDGKSCTTDTCDATTGCGSVLQQGACLIAGACFDAGQADPADPCQVCRASESSSAWSDAEDGAWCLSGSCAELVWTTPRSCVSGACTGDGQVQPCDDGIECTADSCDEETGCGHQVAAGMCLIAGACWDDNGLNPANPCEACASTFDATAWTAVANKTVCVSGSCAVTTWTAAKTCESGTCSGGGQTEWCDDGVSCTQDECSATTGCGHEVETGYCAIGGDCATDGQADPSSVCRSCAATVSATGWTDAVPGTPCGAPSCLGMEWTRPRTCDVGQCAGGGELQGCDDGLSCTADACSNATGCSNVLQAGSCRIDGACYADHAKNPENPCQTCDAVGSPGAWKDAVDGTECVASGCAGLQWTPRRTCESGWCGAAGTPVSCEDSKACTTDACVPATGCSNLVQAGNCLIGGTCLVAGEASIGNACHVCAPVVDALAWTDVLDGTVCGSGNCAGKVFTSAQSCVGGECTGGGGSRNCDDGKACTTDACSAATGCGNSLVAGNCLIDGVCVGVGQTNPASACQLCDVAKATSSWTSIADGTQCVASSCSALDFTSSMTCLYGSCSVGGTLQSCDDGKTCTTDTCAVGTGCGNVLKQGQCLIGGVCYGEGQANPGNGCQACVTASSTTAWTTREDGAQCAAGTCTGLSWTASRTCVSGQCTAGGAVRSCDDGRTCTTDSCDPVAGCGNTLQAQRCLIGATCFADGQANPANVCQACTSAQGTLAWTNVADATQCASSSSCTGLTFTTQKTCVTGQCTAGGATQSCDDGKACTTDACASATGCSNVLQAGQCLISGTCYAQAQANPGNACQLCQTGSSATAWSWRDDGTQCLAGACVGLSWTRPRTCASGQCSGGGALQSCDDGKTCTTDVCDVAAGCSTALKAATCLIDGQCFAEAQANPTNPCLVCTPGTSTTSWSNAGDGTVCLASTCTGLSWNAARTCVTGQCTGGGALSNCDDGKTCTADTCTAATGCGNALVAGNCLIDGTCRTNGQMHPTNGCQKCDIARATLGWSNLTDGVTCVASSCDGLVWSHARTCQTGQCGSLVTSNCDDGKECTADVCDATTGCTSTLSAGFCLVSGTCYASGQLNPSNACNVCTPSSATTSWTGLSNGTQCAAGSCAGLTWTAPRSCSAAQCTVGGGIASCDDGKGCTADACSASGGCSNTLAAGNCLIDGTCWANGQPNPSNACQVCDATRSASAWSSVTDGTQCLAGSCTGLTWTTPRTCAAGQCTGGGGTSSCDDAKTCTTDACGAATGCSNTLQAGNCLIGGICRAGGALNPGNACEACTVATSTSSWSPLANGIQCLASACAGLTWSAAKMCQSGLCTTGGATTGCDDGKACTNDTCDAVKGCGNVLQAGQCLIAGTCWAEGQLNPVNACKVCASTPSTSEWSNATDGTACGAGTCNLLQFTSAKSCLTGACSVGGGTQSCDDGKACTSDACSSGSGCRNEPQSCDDGNQCTNDWCDIVSGDCLHSVNGCDDGDPCTTDSCNHYSGGCVHSVKCGDGDLCTTDTCNPLTGGCSYPLRCNDGLACTTDMCNPATGSCSNGVIVGFCVIGGACIAEGTANLGNACQACIPSKSVTAYSNRDDGAQCQSSTCAGMTWIAAKTCFSGQCTAGGAVQSCDDGKTCTTDACAAVTGCSATIQSGNCLIGGTCYAEGTINVGNACQACKTAQGTTTWGSVTDGTQCQAASCTALNWTAPRTCSSGQCTVGGAVSSCDDSKACTTDSCSAGGCANALQDSYCLIGGTCYGEAQPNPVNTCQNCVTASGTDAWSSIADGGQCMAASCNGLDWKAPLTCAGGQCTLGGAVSSCNDGRACTTDACAAATGCSSALQSGNCLIAGTCYAEGAANGTDACKVCTTTNGSTAWSNATDGTSCGTGGGCVSGTCCNANDHKACSGGSVYWYNSCGNMGALAQTCQYGCTAGACNGIGGCPDGYVLVPSGMFTMGSPTTEPGRYADETEHQVTISKSFCLKATEVTQGEWQALMGNNPSSFSTCGSDCPVEKVSWWDSIAYCNQLSSNQGLTQCYTLTGCTGTPGVSGYTCTGVTFAGLTCTGYRLPTESEWEYAARAGTTTGTYNGTSTLIGYEQPNTVLDTIAWFYGNSASKTQAVKGKTPNAWGLYDMLGNVWEWTGDLYGTYPGTVTDPTGATSGSGPVLRGGGWSGRSESTRLNSSHSDRSRMPSSA